MIRWLKIIAIVVASASGASAQEEPIAPKTVVLAVTLPERSVFGTELVSAENLEDDLRRLVTEQLSKRGFEVVESDDADNADLLVSLMVKPGAEAVGAVGILEDDKAETATVIFAVGRLSMRTKRPDDEWVHGEYWFDEVLEIDDTTSTPDLEAIRAVYLRGFAKAMPFALETVMTVLDQSS